MIRSNNPTKEALSDLLKRPEFKTEDLNKTVSEVLNSVRQSGDEAVRTFSEKFDRIHIADFLVSEKEMLDAESKIDDKLKNAIALASKNIHTFHLAQDIPTPVIQTMPGVTCWQKALPIEKVGLYVPGGTAPLFSTVLMLAIPAKIAGCKEIVLCTPPNAEGIIHPTILYAAKVAGVGKVFKIGGVQAIAAMAYGTESVPQVHKIFGPGNQYVTAAKQLVGIRDVAIDMPAGPSEVAVLADDSAIPAFVASDLLSQAEHGKDSQSVLITTSMQLADAVEIELQKQLEALSRKDFAALSLANSRIIVLDSMEAAIEATNLYAPEHLIISTKAYNQVADKIQHAGSVFLGNFTPESAGDYASGTNHTLPTNGFSKMYSGVHLDSFRKKTTFQEITNDGLSGLAETLDTMAKAEFLTAHANAVNIRLNKNKSN